MRPRHLLALPVAALLLAAGCGSGDSGTSASLRSTTTNSTTETTTTTALDATTTAADLAAATTTTVRAAAPPKSAPSTTTPKTAAANPTIPATTAAPRIQGTITVFAASSLTEAFTDMGKRFQSAHPDAKVTFSFASSSTLATQVNQGAPADVLATADEDSMQTATKAGSTGTPVRFARNLVEIIVAKDNPKKVAGIKDLDRVTYALCDPSVPCGKYAALAFKKNGMTPNPRSYELNVKAVVSRVTSGEVDAGIVYRSDVFSAGSTAAGVAIDGADEPDLQNIYPIALTTKAKDDAVARAWVAYVLSSEGQAVLASYRFLPAPG